MDMPESKQEYINILFTINDFYAKYLSVCMLSILVNTGSPICFSVIDGGISSKNKKKIEGLKKLRDFSIEYLPIDKELFSNMPKSSQMHISNETNYRFLISSLKKDLNKCIFLDADLVLEKDIAELWQIDVDGFYMAAVTDQAPFVANSWTKKLPLPQGYVYANTGVTVMNLRKWREENIESKLFENLEKFRDLLRYPDQDTLNITLCGHIRNLPHKFNAMPVQRYWKKDEEAEAFADPVVVHWAGDRKPWIFTNCEMADVFFKYAKLSPFYEEILHSNIKSDTIREFTQSILPGQTRNTDELKRRASSLEHNSEELRQKVSTLERNSEEMKQKVSTLERNSEEMKQKVSTLERNSEEMKQKVSTLERNSEEMKQKVSTLEHNSEEMKQEVSTLERNSEEMKQKVSTLERNSEEMKQKVSTLEHNSEEMKQKVSTLERNSEEMKQKVSTLERNSEELKQKVSTLERNSEELNQKVSTLERHSEELNQKVSSLVRNSDELKRGMSTVTQAVNGLILLPVLGRKLRRVRLRCHLTLGARKKKYLREKIELKNKIRELQQVVGKYEMF